MITYEGVLKIGDFGMATPWPAARGIDGEGDREYMGPEILRGRFDKPADVFALGLIILEIACNVFLPDNGPSWTALREGDLSVVPSLTGSESSAIVRDATGMPISQDRSPRDVCSSSFAVHGWNGLVLFLPFGLSGASTHNARNLFGPAKRIELEHPPAFMVNVDDPGSLDKVVAWMTLPEPECRPTAHELLANSSVCWVSTRRRAPATVFEGNWGPGDVVTEPAIFNTENDAEMTGV